MTLFDRIVLLLTGLTAIYLVWRLFQDYQRKDEKPVYDIYYMISFVVLLVAGLLLIFFTYDVLANPLVVVVAYLLPFTLALGLVAEFYKKYGTAYLIIGLIGLIGIFITRVILEPGGFATFLLALFHSIAGLIIFFIPIFAVKNQTAPGGFIFVTVGGALIGIGGIALAFLKAGAPILSQELIFTILAPILFLMILAYTWGFMKKMAASKS